MDDSQSSLNKGQVSSTPEPITLTQDTAADRPQDDGQETSELPKETTEDFVLEGENEIKSAPRTARDGRENVSPEMNIKDPSESYFKAYLLTGEWSLRLRSV